MRQKLSTLELWNRVRARDLAIAAKRSRGLRRDGSEPVSPRFFIQVHDSDGNAYPGEVVKALTAVEQTETRSLSRREKARVKRSSTLIADGFKVLTIGGTVTFDRHGRGGAAVTCDHTGARVKALELQIKSYGIVDIQVTGKISMDRVDDTTLGLLVRLAAKDDPELSAQIERILEAGRSLL
jgi:hypothetical protein